MLIKVMKLVDAIRLLGIAIFLTNQRRMDSFRSWILIFKAKIQLRIMIKRHGPDTFTRQRIQSREVFSLMHNYMVRQVTRKCKLLLKNFIMVFEGNRYFKNKLVKYIDRLEFVQKRIRNQLAIRYSKVEMLIKYWDMLLSKMQKQAKRARDKEIIMAIFKVSPSIRWSLLLDYVNKCREIYQIAFFQWRHKKYIEKGNEKPNEELEELIEFRINYTYHMYQDYGERNVDGTSPINKSADQFIKNFNPNQEKEEESKLPKRRKRGKTTKKKDTKPKN